ncbi:hypothetical protein ASPVEDRAFT_28541 [Aspergillus versicolor CBS 583.65]|uniref:Ecp2 effector protein domain-containing protein n=1 Tax=Aspergillus versicolor CBS 583.65 TaxID=1036611 RepID=A0A1L9PK54_ASPVE|nr:uncharacterized protein ASPVEDRAFT_28541 [Aspergillus versicolor CBS 583.65]OJJ01909.1 hypothetical protein ASPVEDRAFT_28541 [Aspergillus versicolor CBS 583.65]
MKWQSTLFILGALASQVLGATDTINCDSEGSAVYALQVQSGIDYLNDHAGQPVAEAGKCNRVSCSYGAGIYVCSDDGKDHPLKSWKTVATVASKILHECRADTNYVKGRLHSSDGWGVAIRDAPC